MLDKVKEFIRREAFRYSLEIIAEKEISYGVQLLVCDVNSSFDDSLPVNVYYSAKKGISIVVGGSDKSPIKKKVQQLVEQVKIASYNGFEENRPSRTGQTAGQKTNLKMLHSWSKWIGTDESGKGDFFGPLVASGFYCDKSIVEDLVNMGIMDSKRLSDKQIYAIAYKIFAKYRNRIETVSLLPETYNRLYLDFTKQNKKLNELMAWMHSRIILNLAKKFSCEGALIDKFTSDEKVKASLKEMESVRILQRPRAEEDIAVATASVIARYNFLQGLDALSKKYKIRLPKGANRNVIDTGKEFLKTYGEDKMGMVCKTHFKTFEYITNRNQGIIEL